MGNERSSSNFDSHLIISEALTVHFVMANKVGGMRGCGWMTCGFLVRRTVTMENTTTFGVLFVEHAKDVCYQGVSGMEDWLFHSRLSLPLARFEIENPTLSIAFTAYWKVDLDRLAMRTRLRS